MHLIIRLSRGPVPDSGNLGNARGPVKNFKMKLAKSCLTKF